MKDKPTKNTPIIHTKEAPNKKRKYDEPIVVPEMVELGFHNVMRILSGKPILDKTKI